MPLILKTINYKISWKSANVDTYSTCAHESAQYPNKLIATHKKNRIEHVSQLHQNVSSHANDNE